MESFVSRVSEEEGPSQIRNIIDNLHVAKYVKCLRIAYDCMEAQHPLASAIPYLTKLKKLVWVASTSESSHSASIFMLIRKYCLDFDCLSMNLNWIGVEEDEHTNSVLVFKGLRHLALRAPYWYSEDDKRPSAMTNMVRFSPDLVTLDLCITDAYGFPPRAWNADAFFESIKGTQYPHLRCLKLHGATGIDLHRLSDISAIPSPFHSFIVLNHRNIVALAMPIPINDSERGLDDLRLPKDMFPSLREFEGTISWCFYISGLHYPASRLRRMKFLIQGSAYEDGEELACERVHGALKSCLVLTELDIRCNDIFLTADRIRVLSEHAPGLRSLQCFIDLHETLDSISSALGQFGALRFIAFNHSYFKVQEDTVLFTLAKKCPSLIGVKDSVESHMHELHEVFEYVYV
ncbi:hypothetical protein FPV67DRAFT_1495475 [Lyophyllum atratum]|nr:hypothetical protein FPV67DRAFT_1495475 [Lyophyllum atratum]